MCILAAAPTTGIGRSTDGLSADFADFRRLLWVHRSISASHRAAVPRDRTAAPNERLAAKVVVRPVQPVVADRAEDVERQRVVERFDLMLDPGWNDEHLPLADDRFLTTDEKPQRTLHHVRELLAFVLLHWHQRAALQIDLRQHLALAGDDLARDHLGHLLERDLIPSVQPHAFS